MVTVAEVLIETFILSLFQTADVGTETPWWCVLFRTLSIHLLSFRVVYYISVFLLNKVIH